MRTYTPQERREANARYRRRQAQRHGSWEAAVRKGRGLGAAGEAIKAIDQLSTGIIYLSGALGFFAVWLFLDNIV
jgi:hypothetical protein